MTIASGWPTPGARLGVPRWVLSAADGEKSKAYRSAKPATSPPASCAIQYVGTRSQGCFPATARPNVTAGLKCPPESAPNAETATASASPCASAMGTTSAVGVATDVTIAPAPMKKNMNVPAASASSARVCPLMCARFPPA